MNDNTSMRILLIITLCCVVITLTQFIDIDDDVQVVTESINYDSTGYVKGTGSMEPFIPSTAKIYYKYDFELEVGKIYVYHKPENNDYIIHRLVYVDDDECFFKGDNNVNIDIKINCSQVIKEVVAIEFDPE